MQFPKFWGQEANFQGDPPAPPLSSSKADACRRQQKTNPALRQAHHHCFENIDVLLNLGSSRTPLKTSSKIRSQTHKKPTHPASQSHALRQLSWWKPNRHSRAGYSCTRKLPPLPNALLNSNSTASGKTSVSIARQASKAPSCIMVYIKSKSAIKSNLESGLPFETRCFHFQGHHELQEWDIYMDFP